MDGKVHNSSKLEVTLFKGPAERGIVPGSTSLPKRQFNNLFVKNIPAHFTSQHLEDVFKEFGEIVSCKVVGSDSDEESKDQGNKGYGFVCFKNCNDARQALLKFIETKEESSKSESAPLASTGEQAYSDGDDSDPKDAADATAGKSKLDLKLYVAPHMKREFREHFLRLKTLRFKRTMAKHNLYFRGFQSDGDAASLKGELTDYFA